MKPSRGSPPRLVLAGLGHAHLFVVEALSRGRLPPLRPVLISPDDAYFYSGMVSGVIAGCYTPEQAMLRPSRLARAAGAEWIQGRVVHVEPGARRVHLDDGSALDYDLLSLNVGARLGSAAVPGSDRYGVPIKPFNDAVQLSRRAVAAAGPTPARIVVVGGGAGGWEIAMCLDAALRRAVGVGRYAITILEGGDTVLGEHPRSVGARAARLLQARDIRLRTRARVREASEREVCTEEGEAVSYDVLVWATGPAAPPLFRESGLPTDEHGYLGVLPTLQARGIPSIFGAGDCVGIHGAPWVPKAGVYAVREGPVLVENLTRRLAGEPLREYQPQRSWLSLMNTGDGRALMSYRGLAGYGAPLWWLKNQIDRRFVRRFQRLEE